MKPGEVRINLHNLDKIDIGEYIITDGNIHILYSPYLDCEGGGVKISTSKLKAILRINLHNLDKIDIGEYIITDGNIHILYSPYLDCEGGGVKISTSKLKAIL